MRLWAGVPWMEKDKPRSAATSLAQVPMALRAFTLVAVGAVAAILVLSALSDPRDRRVAYHILRDSRRAASAAAAARKYPYHLCLMTRVRNSASIITEWLEYHKLVGVDHFFIADDCSTDDGRTQLVLSVHQDEGLVTFSPSQPFNNCSDHQPNEANLFNHLLGMAKPMCRWVGVWDLDEYLTISDSRFWYDLGGFLDKQVHDVVRMPWWIMGSDGHETKPPGLIIENYHHGYLQPLHVKSIARSHAVPSWDFSLFPVRYERHSTLATDSDLYKYYTSIELHDDEMVTYKTEDGSSCQFPTSSLFLRHYMTRSFEEYMETRGAINLTSNGDVNPWAVNPREKWLSHWFNGTCNLGDDFTTMMATRVRERMQQHVWGSARVTAPDESEVSETV